MIIRPTIIKGLKSKFKNKYYLNENGAFAEKYNLLGSKISSKSVRLENITTIDFGGWPIGKVIFGEGSHYPVVWENVLFPKSVYNEANGLKNKLLNKKGVEKKADSSLESISEIPWWEIYPDLTSEIVLFPSFPNHVVEVLNKYKKDKQRPLFNWLVPDKSKVSIDQPIIQLNLLPMKSKYRDENFKISPIIKATENGLLNIKSIGRGKWEPDKYNSIIGSYRKEKYYDTTENIWYSIQKAKGREDYGICNIMEVFGTTIKYFYSLPIEFESWDGFGDLEDIDLNMEKGRNKFFIEILANLGTNIIGIEES